jgi:uncharacterized protein
LARSSACNKAINRQGDKYLKPVILLPQGLQLRVYLQPNARQDCLQGLHGDELKISIVAPAIDGKANVYLCKLLARWCKVSNKQVVIIKGKLSRHKTVFVCDLLAVPVLFNEYAQA